MTLKLNATREAYQEFYGRNVEQMPKLIADGRVPMNTSQYMQKRLEFRFAPFSQVSDDVKSPLCKFIEQNWDNLYKNKEQALAEWNAIKSAWIDNYSDTGDGAGYHPDGRVKIVLDSQHLRDMTPDTPRDTPRNGGALLLSEDAYNALEGEEFKKGKLGKVNGWMSRDDVKAHPVWKVLARDQGLLNDYTDHIFGEYQARFAKGTPLEDVRAMGVFPDSAGDNPKMRAWCVDRLEYRSLANSRGDLGSDVGRLLGIAPEALSAPGKGASNIKAYTMADLQAFDSAVKGLEATVRPELLKPFTQLRKKL